MSHEKKNLFNLGAKLGRWIARFLSALFLLGLLLGLRLHFGPPLTLYGLPFCIRAWAPEWSIASTTLTWHWNHPIKLIFTEIHSPHLHVQKADFSWSYYAGFLLKGYTVTFITDLFAQRSTSIKFIPLLAMDLEDVKVIGKIKNYRLCIRDLSILHRAGNIEIRRQHKKPLIVRIHYQCMPEMHLINAQIYDIPIELNGIMSTWKGGIKGKVKKADSSWAWDIAQLHQTRIVFPSQADVLIKDSILRGTWSPRKICLEGHLSLDKNLLRFDLKAFQHHEWKGTAQVSAGDVKLDIPWILCAWPSGWSPDLRQWLREQIHSGWISGLKGVYHWRYDALKGFSIDHQKTDLYMQHIKMSFMKDMEPITQMMARAQIWGNACLIDVQRGCFKKHVLKGQIDIKPLGERAHFKCSLDLQGPLDTLLKTLTIFASSTPNIKQVHGKSKTQLVCTFPLGQAFDPSLIRLDLKSHTPQAEFLIKVENHFLHCSNTNLQIVGINKKFKIIGQGLVSDVSTRWCWSSQKDDVHFTSTFSAQNLQRLLDLDLTPYISMPLVLKGHYQDQRLEYIVDLEERTCHIPWIKWHKPRGQSLKILGQHKNDIWHIKINGSMQADGFWNTQKNLGEMRCTWPTCLLIYKKQGPLHEIFCHGDYLEIPDLTYKKSTPESRDFWQHLWENLRIDLGFRCVNMKQTKFSYFSAHLHHAKHPTSSNAQWQESHIEALVKRNDRSFGVFFIKALPLSPSCTALYADIAQMDHLLEDLGFGRAVSAHSLALKVLQKNDEYRGSVKIIDLRTPTSFFGKLLSLVSPGLISELFSSGLLFHEVYSEIFYKKGQIMLDKTICKGINLGLLLKGNINLDQEKLALSGVVVPSYLLNTFFSYVPIIGWLFGGNKGILSSDFRMSGSFARPRVHIEPFSFLQFGFIKNIFGSYPEDQLFFWQSP